MSREGKECGRDVSREGEEQEGMRETDPQIVCCHSNSLGYSIF